MFRLYFRRIFVAHHCVSLKVNNWSSHLPNSPVCAGVYSWPPSPACWVCLHTGTILVASTLCSGTACERRGRRGPSTGARLSPVWTGDLGAHHRSSSGARGCPQAGAPPPDFRPAGSASHLGSMEWGGSLLDWRWSPPSPDCPGKTRSRAGGNLTEGCRQVEVFSGAFDESRCNFHFLKMDLLLNSIFQYNLIRPLMSAV